MRLVGLAILGAVMAFARDAGADDLAARPPEPLACLSRWYDARVDGDHLVLGNGEQLALDLVRTMFAVPYRAGAIRPVVDPNEDPGRTRIEALFRATYGGSAKAVEAELVSVKLGPRAVRVHRRVAPALARVAARLDPDEPALQKLGGTFAWRTIAGTTDRSAHSWGIAVDLDPMRSDYWRNDSLTHPKWKNRIPQSVVDAFEAEGFIWGGRWYHYDTMHFEYRPELFAAACAPAHLATAP